MNENLELLKAKRNPINSCADLSRSMRGKRYGILYFTEEFRIDFENKMCELNRIKELEMEIQVLENTRNSCPCIKTSGVSCDLKSFSSNDCISKDKIRAKIEELKDKEEELTDDQGYWGYTELITQIEVLEDLLEG